MNVVALGSDVELSGMVLAGVRVVRTSSPDELRAAWQDLGDDVGLVLLSRADAEILGDALHERSTTLVAVTP